MKDENKKDFNYRIGLDIAIEHFVNQLTDCTIPKNERELIKN